MLKVSHKDYEFYSFPDASICDIDDEKIKLFITYYNNKENSIRYRSDSILLFNHNKIAEISIDEYKEIISKYIEKYFIKDISSLILNLCSLEYDEDYNQPCKYEILHKQKFDYWEKYCRDLSEEKWSDDVDKYIPVNIKIYKLTYICEWSYNNKEYELMCWDGGNLYTITNNDKLVSFIYDPSTSLQCGDCGTDVYIIDTDILICNNGDVSSVVYIQSIHDNKHTFVDFDGNFIVPENDTLIFLNPKKITKDEYKLLVDVFCHVIIQKEYITIYINHDCEHLVDRYHTKENYDNYEVGLEERITRCLHIILKNFSHECIVYKHNKYT